MTGFGRAEVVTKERKITIELKSVNHRYLDLSIKMPRKLNFLEGAVRNLMKTYIQRGKVDVRLHPGQRSSQIQQRTRIRIHHLS